MREISYKNGNIQPFYVEYSPNFMGKHWIYVSKLSAIFLSQLLIIVREVKWELYDLEPLS